MPARSTTLQWFAAKLLFQFRVVVNGVSSKRRTCEVRIVLLRAKTPRSALAQAKKSGRGCNHRYENSDGNPVFFEFIGVMDLLHLGLECEQNEVWYDIVELMEPMERADKLLSSEDKLLATPVSARRPPRQHC